MDPVRAARRIVLPGTTAATRPTVTAAPSGLRPRPSALPALPGAGPLKGENSAPRNPTSRSLPAPPRAVFRPPPLEPAELGTEPRRRLPASPSPTNHTTATAAPRRPSPASSHHVNEEQTQEQPLVEEPEDPEPYPQQEDLQQAADSAPDDTNPSEEGMEFLFCACVGGGACYHQE
ncbi:hypothetical protein U9M48_026039 [Paspalum notatum var. saurae]|uniref:Uncharacterized protein n=2 Tax=Paspalum notatum var. saurae TaxID=547442 RepID=A0AAQ3TRS9_PASNO